MSDVEEAVAGHVIHVLALADREILSLYAQNRLLGWVGDDVVAVAERQDSFFELDVFGLASNELRKDA